MDSFLEGEDALGDGREASRMRPDEQVPLVGDYGKAATMFGWRPRRKLADIVHEMVQADIRQMDAR